MNSKRLRRCVSAALLAFPVLLFIGCAYRLPAGTPPSRDEVRIVSRGPQRYRLTVDTGSIENYEVPADGRVTIAIPSYRPACGVYLFDLVKVGGFYDPLKSWTLTITKNGETMKRLSLRRMRDLQVDDAGYHILHLVD